MSDKTGKPLTSELVFTKTKSDSLKNIKNLNLWGCELDDLTLIQEMPNLEVISLSVNRISSLKYFHNCTKLQELYLRKNNIADLQQIKYLTNLPVLKVLWLHDNPCAQVNNYREIVVKCLPNLQKLDNNPVTPEERNLSKNISFNLQPIRPQNVQEREEKQEKKSLNHHSSVRYEQEHTSKALEQKSRFNNNGRQKQKFLENPNPSRRNEVYEQSKSEDIKKNQNILMAVLSLMRQLDGGSLQIVRRQASKMIDQV